MDYSDAVFWKTKEESRIFMQQAAEFKTGDTILVCRNKNFYHHFNEEERLMYSDARLAGSIIKIQGMTNHRGTWSGTWKYKVRIDGVAAYVDFGIASQPGKCANCRHRLTRLMGRGLCPGYFESIEEENQSS